MKIEGERRDREPGGVFFAGARDGSLGEFARFMRGHLGCRAVIIRLAERFAPLFAGEGDPPAGAPVCALAPDWSGAVADSSILRDPALLVDPITAGDAGFRFFAGLPLRLSTGEDAGMLVAIDRYERALPGNDLATLRMLAAIIAQVIEFRLATAGIAAPLRQRRSDPYPPRAAGRGG